MVEEPLPLDVLEAQVNEWISGQANTPVIERDSSPYKKNSWGGKPGPNVSASSRIAWSQLPANGLLLWNQSLEAKF